MVAALVFDFDGVIVPGSEQIKQQAWDEVFRSYGDSYKEPLSLAEAKYGRGRGGDRFDILRSTYSALGEYGSMLEEHVTSGANTFDAVVQEKILSYGVDDDTRRVLQSLSRRWPLYINSATPTSALERTVCALEIDSFFTGIYGRPAHKVDILTRISKEVGCMPSELLFVGDSATDEKAALQCGCSFIGYGSREWEDRSISVVASFIELERMLEDVQ